ncbi:MAG: hypothetical protein KKD44_26925 [Proteobacteria bacterium]|nr:hypothetical protein [Pseudomonadota bacterium]
MPKRINGGYMFESLLCFINETLPDAGMVCPDSPTIFIIIAANGKDLTYYSTSNSRKKTLATLKRVVKLEVLSTEASE